ncbi:unnamed protein product, partial [Hapterophycus canaliculatus]
SPPAKCLGAWASPPAALAWQRQQQQQWGGSAHKAEALRKPLPLPPQGGNDQRPSFRGGVRAAGRCSGARCGYEGHQLPGRAAAVGKAVPGGDGRVLLAISADTAGSEGDNGDHDIWRDSMLRYAGYANEVGESFRHIAPRLVVPSYAVSIAYVLGDTVDKGYKDYAEGKGVTAVGKMSLDVLLWQSLASVAVPGLTINLTVKAMGAVMASDQAKSLLSKGARKW